MAAATGCSKVGFQTGSQTQDLIPVPLSQDDEIGHLQATMGQGAGLVQGDGLQGMSLFQVKAALDQNAAPCSGG